MWITFKLAQQKIRIIILRFWASWVWELWEKRLKNSYKKNHFKSQRFKIQINLSLWFTVKRKLFLAERLDRIFLAKSLLSLCLVSESDFLSRNSITLFQMMNVSISTKSQAHYHYCCFQFLKICSIFEDRFLQNCINLQPFEFYLFIICESSKKTIKKKHRLSMKQN